MCTVSPLVVEAFTLLRLDLYEDLDKAEFLAQQRGGWSDEDIDKARTLIPDLVVVIRGLLIEHKAQADAACRICRSAWPCPVVTTIHALLKDPQDQFAALISRTRRESA